jgi:Spy/CpxP family protein refolding chaperone
MPGEKQKLQEMLNSAPIATADTMKQVTRVLGMESEFKLSHFRLLIAIKNALTAEQITQLNRAIRQRLKKDGA